MFMCMHCHQFHDTKSDAECCALRDASNGIPKASTGIISPDTKEINQLKQRIEELEAQNKRLTSRGFKDLHHENGELQDKLDLTAAALQLKNDRIQELEESLAVSIDDTARCRKRIEELEAHKGQLIDALEDMVFQFAYRNKDDLLITGGLSALENAFTTLGIDERTDPNTLDGTQIHPDYRLQRINELQATLKKVRPYLQHKDTCEVRKTIMARRVCTCGLEQAIKGDGDG